AIECALESQRICRSIPDNRGVLRTYGIIGSCYINKGDFRTAEKYIKFGIESSQKIDDRVEEATFICNLADIKTVLGEIKMGLDLYLRAADISAHCGNFEILLRCMTGISKTSVRLNKWDTLFKVIANQIVIFGSRGESTWRIFMAQIIED